MHVCSGRYDTDCRMRIQLLHSDAATPPPNASFHIAVFRPARYLLHTV